MAPLSTEGAAAAGYREAWRGIARSMESGVSWSGHERNVAWLQGDSGRFVDASAVCGLDQVEDGRVALACDWDGDGDEDLWLRSRSGVTLRYLENQADPERHLVFEPGAPGNSVVVEIGSPGEAHRVVLQTASTQGYLAGTRPRAIHALREGEQAAAVSGEVGAVRVVGAAAREAPEAGPLTTGDLPSRVVLRSPLELPPGQLEAAGFRPGRPLLLVIEDPECERCAAQLPPLLAKAAASEPLDLCVRSTGNPEHARCVRWASTTAAHLLGPSSVLDTPLSLLIGPRGRLQALRIGALEWDDLSLDLRGLCLEPVQGAFRSTVGPFGASRWFHGMVRSNVALSEDLRAADLAAEADSYSRAGR